LPSLSPTDIARLEGQLRLIAAVREACGPLAVPYLGHMRLDTGVRQTDVLLAGASRVLPGLAVIDWQAAPLAEVFFAHDEGEDYEVEIDQRQVSGRLLEKTGVVFDQGELVQLHFTGGTLTRQPDGQWVRRDGPSAPPLARRPVAVRKPFRSPLEVTLDAAQRQVVDLPPNRSVLLLGEAGFGKTTVALHRLVALRERFQERGAGKFRGAVMVPTEGLARLTELMLERRGITDLDVWTYEEWAKGVARRIFRELPRRLSQNATTGVVQLKRHPAVRDMLVGYARTRPKPAQDEDHPGKPSARASRWDLEHMFGNRRWMERLIEKTQGAVFPRVAAEMTEHTRIQFLDPAEVTYAHVDRAALATLDGRAIDEGTPMEDANSVDLEDLAVLFELERIRSRAAGAQPAVFAAYHCLVVDEAQEFAALELALMGRAVRADGTVIVAGDAAQQVDPTTSFSGWDSALRELAAEGAERAVLEVSYRCPPDVTAVARSVLSAEAAPSPTEPSITRVRHETLFHLAAWLTAELRDLVGEDPQASVAVICRSPEAARTFARFLGHGTPPHLALGGEFEFRPGLTVSCVQEVKGLEFDYVILPDVTPGSYPDSPESRRALYVAITRATHRLTLAATGDFSPLLRPRGRLPPWPVGASQPT